MSRCSQPQGAKSSDFLLTCKESQAADPPGGPLSAFRDPSALEVAEQMGSKVKPLLPLLLLYLLSYSPCIFRRLSPKSCS